MKKTGSTEKTTELCAIVGVCERVEKMSMYMTANVCIS